MQITEPIINFIHAAVVIKPENKPLALIIEYLPSQYSNDDCIGFIDNAILNYKTPKEANELAKKILAITNINLHWLRRAKAYFELKKIVFTIFNNKITANRKDANDIIGRTINYDGETQKSFTELLRTFTNQTTNQNQMRA